MLPGGYGGIQPCQAFTTGCLKVQDPQQLMPLICIHSHLVNINQLKLRIGEVAQVLHLSGTEWAGAIREEKWEDLPCSEYSFKIFQVLRFDADIMQSLLSLTSTAERLQRIYALLTGDKFPLGS